MMSKKNTLFASAVLAGLVSGMALADEAKSAAPTETKKPKKHHGKADGEKAKKKKGEKDGCGGPNGCGGKDMGAPAEAGEAKDK